MSNDFFYQVKKEVTKQVRTDFNDPWITYLQLLTKYGIEHTEYNMSLHGTALVAMIAQNVTVREFRKQMAER